MKLSIIIPAHNEENRIEKTLDYYYNFFKGKKYDFEIIVVLNACKDDTENVVKKFLKHKEIRYIQFKEGGKGFAIKEGFRDALKRDNELIGFVDADMATSPASFYELAENIDCWDGIIASRYIKGAVIKQKQPFSRILVSRIGNFIIRSMFFMNYKDTQCGAKIFTRNAIEKLLPKLEMTHWGTDIDMLYKAKKLGLKIKEFPTFWDDREGSKLQLGKTSVQVLLSSARLRMINSCMKDFTKIIEPIAKRVHKLIQ